MITTTNTSDVPGGKPLPNTPTFKIRPKQKFKRSDGTYGGYSGTEEGRKTIEAKRIRLARNSGTTKRHK